jgi:hypothetical protein
MVLAPNGRAWRTLIAAYTEAERRIRNAQRGTP